MRRSKERGQALVLVALAATVVFGVVALAVDAGMLYATRRHLQNVADQAALIGAQWLPEDPSTAESKATIYAKDKLNNDLGKLEITVDTDVPPSAGLYKDDATDSYIEVRVLQNRPVLFAGVIGQGPTIPVSARAVATNKVSTSGRHALLALKHDDHGNADNTAITLNGNSAVLVDGSVWSNGWVYVGGSAEVSVTGTTGSYDGGVNNPNGNFSGNLIDPTAGTIIPDPLKAHPLPFTGPLPSPGANFTMTAGEVISSHWAGWRVAEPTCKFGVSGTYVCDPNRIYRSIDIAGTGAANERVIFRPGVYVVVGDISFKRADVVGWDDPDHAPPTDFLNENAHPWSEFPGVSFYLPSGGNDKFTLLSDARVRFNTSKEYFDHIVLWSNSRSTTDALNVASDATLMLRGIVYAPDGGVSLNGGSTAPQVLGQVIANTITINGGSSAAVKYDSSVVATEKMPRLVE